MRIHVVSPGDTVWRIAQQYGVTPQRIISDNGLTQPGTLVMGQALIILIPEVVYTSRQGDSLSSVASRFGVSEMVLLQNNPYLVFVPFLLPGQSIVITFSGAPRRTIAINGYTYPNIQPELLRQTLPFLTYLTIFGYGFTLNGELIGIDDAPLISMAFQYRTAPVMLLSTVTEDGSFSGERAHALFTDPALQKKLLDNIIRLMQQKGYRGLDMDFEFVEPEDADAYLSFLKATAARLRSEGFFLNTDLAPKTSSEQRGVLYEAHDYAAIGAISDTVLLMTYEWGYTYGPPMAVAPLDQVRHVVEYAVTQIEPEKIFLGIPNYAYDWLLPFQEGLSRATSIGNQYAVEIAARYGAVIRFDETAQTPFFEYYDSQNRPHIVWFEDVRSIRAKFDLLDEFGLMGAGYWNLMRPFNQNWAFLSERYDIRKIL